MTTALHTELPMTVSDRRHHAIRSANRMLAPGAAVILDTETVDLGAAICEIAVIDTNCNVLLDTLVNPNSAGSWIHPDTHRVHDIDNHMLRDAPCTRTVLNQLLNITAGYRYVLGYNAEYDQSVIAPARTTGLDQDHLADPSSWGCIMRARSEASGHPEHYLPLDGGHRALPGSLAALDVLRLIAATPEVPR